jgi:hypothetical protein
MQNGLDRSIQTVSQRTGSCDQGRRMTLFYSSVAGVWHNNEIELTSDKPEYSQYDRMPERLSVTDHHQPFRLLQGL